MLRRTVPVAFLALSALVIGCNSDVGNDGVMVGGSCVVSSECYVDSYCLTGEAWPNGYCATPCEVTEPRFDGDPGACPDGSVCVQEEGGICVVACGGEGDCRTSEDDGGYACAELEPRGSVDPVMGCVAAD